MQCHTCKREMVSLFLSQVCDYCDYGIPEDKLHRGFIVYRLDSDATFPREEYVFRTRMDVARWRSASNREGCAIYKVFSLMPYQWHMSRGTLRDVVLADHMFSVFENWKYEPLPHRCFLAERQVESNSPVDDETDELPF